MDYSVGVGTGGLGFYLIYSMFASCSAPEQFLSCLRNLCNVPDLLHCMSSTYTIATLKPILIAL